MIFDILHPGMVILDVSEDMLRVVTWNGSATIRFFSIDGGAWHEYDVMALSGSAPTFDDACEALARHDAEA